MRKPALVVSVLAPLAVALPALCALARGGDAAFERDRVLVIREGERAIAAAQDEAEIRHLVGEIAKHAHDVHAPRLYLAVLERWVELVPGDAEARERRDRARASLGLAPAPSPTPR